MKDTKDTTKKTSSNQQTKKSKVIDAKLSEQEESELNLALYELEKRIRSVFE